MLGLFRLQNSLPSTEILVNNMQMNCKSLIVELENFYTPWKRKNTKGDMEIQHLTELGLFRLQNSLPSTDILINNMQMNCKSLIVELENFYTPWKRKNTKGDMEIQHLTELV